MIVENLGLVTLFSDAYNFSTLTKTSNKQQIPRSQQSGSEAREKTEKAVTQPHTPAAYKFSLQSPHQRTLDSEKRQDRRKYLLASRVTPAGSFLQAETGLISVLF